MKRATSTKLFLAAAITLFALSTQAQKFGYQENRSCQRGRFAAKWENRHDRKEDRWEAKRDGRCKDRREDKRDWAEDRRDRREDFRDRHEYKRNNNKNTYDPKTIYSAKG